MSIRRSPNADVRSGWVNFFTINVIVKVVVIVNVFNCFSYNYHKLY